MLKPARPYYHLWHDDHRLLSFDFPLLHQGEEIWSCPKKILVQSQARVLFSFAAGGGEENFIPTSFILIGAQTNSC